MSKAPWLTLWIMLVSGSASAIGETTSEPSVPPEIQKAIVTLRDSSRSLDRREAARSLTRMYPPTPQALSALLKSLEDADIDVVRDSTRTLALLGVDADKSVPAIVTALRRLLPTASKTNVAPIGDMIRSLRYFGPEARSAIKVLKNLLSYKDRQIRVAVAIALRHFGAEAKEAVPALEAILKEKSSETGQAALRIHTAYTLWKIEGPKNAISHLITELQNVNPPLTDIERRMVLEYLARLGPNASESAWLLGRVLTLSVDNNKLPPSDEALKPLLGVNADQAVMPALIEMGPAGQAAVVPLTRWLATMKDRQIPHERWSLPLRALTAIGPDAVSARSAIESLLHDRADNLDLEASLALFRITGERSYLKRLTEALHDTDSRVQKAALECLGRSEDKTMVTVIRQVLDRDYAELRSLAILTWAKLDPCEEVAQLAGQMLRRRRTNEEVYHAVRALSLVGPLARPFGADLRRLLADNDSDRLREAALEALLNAKGPMAPLPEEQPVMDSRLTYLLSRLRSLSEGGLDSKAVEELAKLRPMPVELLPVWIDILDRRDATLTRTAASAIGQCGEQGASAVPALVRAARADQNFATHEAIVLTLIGIGAKAKASVPYFVETSRHYEARVRGWAVAGLQAVGQDNRDAIEALKRLVKQDETELQVKAAQALATLAPEENGVVALAALLMPTDPQTTSVKSQRDAATAIITLARQGNAEAMRVTIRYLELVAKQITAERERTAAPGELRGVVDPARQAELLLVGLADLRSLNDAKPVLRRLISETHWSAAVYPLIRHGDADDRSVLQAVLAGSKTDVSSPATVFARAALYHITREEEYLEGVKHALSARDAQVSLAAFQAAMELGPEAVTLLPRIRELLPVLRGSTQLTAETAIFTIGREEESLRTLIAKRNEPASEEAVYRTLARLAHRVPETIPTINQAAREPGQAVQRAILLQEIRRIAK